MGFQPGFRQRMSLCTILLSFLLILSVHLSTGETKRFRRWSARPSCSYCSGQSYSIQSSSSNCGYCGSVGYVAQPNPCSSGCYSNNNNNLAFSRGRERGKTASRRIGNLLHGVAGFVTGLACGGGSYSSGCRTGGCGGGHSTGCGSRGCGNSGGYNSGGGATVIVVQPSSGSSS